MAVVGKNHKYAALTLALLMSCTTALAREPDKVEGWLFEQRSLSDGNFTVVFSDSGVKLTNGDIICTCSGPTWQAAIANAKTKAGLVMPLKDWAEAGFHISRERAVCTRTTEKSGQWRGQPISCIARSVSGVDPLSKQIELGFRGSEHAAAGYTVEQVTVSKWIALSPQILVFLDGVYREPGLKQLLLKRENLYPDGRIDINLDTLICRRVTIAPNEFRIPFKFRTAKDRDEITLDSKKRGNVFGVLKDFLGVDDDTAPAKPKH